MTVRHLSGFFRAAGVSGQTRNKRQGGNPADSKKFSVHSSFLLPLCMPEIFSWGDDAPAFFRR
jgi:hypothetical protein